MSCPPSHLRRPRHTCPAVGLPPDFWVALNCGNPLMKRELPITMGSLGGPLVSWV